jgi:hypothetical protein
MKPLKTASAMRKALEGKAPGWIPTTFGAPGPQTKAAGDLLDEYDEEDVMAADANGDVDGGGDPLRPR